MFALALLGVALSVAYGAWQTGYDQGRREGAMSRTIRNRPHWRRSWSTALPWQLERDYCCRQQCCSPKAMRRAGYLPHRDRRRLAD